MSRPKRNFAPMPLAVLASDATPQEKLFVLAIMHHDWDGEKAWPSMARLALLTGFSERTLRRARLDLEARGWLKVEIRDGRSSIYSLDVPDMGFDEFNLAVKRAACEGTPATQSGVPRPHSPGYPGHTCTPTPATQSGTPATQATPLRTRTKNENQENENQDPLPASPAGAFRAADGTGWTDLLRDYADHFKIAKADPAAEPQFIPADFAQLKRLAKDARFTRAIYRARLANMAHHAFHADTEYSLTYFCTRFREFDDQAERIKNAKRGAGPGRRGQYNPVDAEDFNG